MIRKYLCLRFHISNFNTNKDYYKILDVKQNATTQQIKKAFRTLAKQYHPDANKGNQQKFKQLNQAYQVLSSEVNKKDYDDARKGPQQSTQYNQYNSYNTRYQTNYQQNQYYRQDPARPNTYRGYQQQTGWNNRNFREQAMRNMHYRQYQQYVKQSHAHARANNTQQQHFDELLRKRAKPQFTSSRSFEEQLNENMKQSAQYIKITRQSVRKAYQQQQKRREEQFKKYRDQQNAELAKQVKDRVWKMAEGVKENVDGLVKVGKYVKQNLQAATKVGKLAKSWWDQFKNDKKK